jgi:hypothetical protein
MMGELPSGTSFTFVNGGTTYHVQMMQHNDGQWYFTVWHLESSWSWASWSTVNEMKWDITDGQVPAYHNPEEAHLGVLGTTNAKTPPPLFLLVDAENV